MKHNVRVIQVFRVEREAVMEVEAPDMEAAIEEIASGNTEVLDFDDSRWSTLWDLQDESVWPA